MKICSKCKKEKELEEFTKCKKALGGYNYYCKECIKKINILNKKNNPNYYKEYYIKNKNYINTRNKNWIKENKERFDLINKKWELNNPQRSKENRNNWRKNNKESIRNRDKIWKFEKRKNNPNFRVLDNTRVRINKAIQKGFKNKHTLELIGCKIEEYRKYQESMFFPEWAWSNYGELWEIDHIIPCSSFDLTKLEEQQKCFHYTNTRPIWKTTETAKQYGYLSEIGNRDKSDKII